MTREQIIELDEQACSLGRRISTLEDHFRDMHGNFYRKEDEREHKRLLSELAKVDAALDKAQEDIDR